MPKKILSGIVVSDKPNKTINMMDERKYTQPSLTKIIREKKKKNEKKKKKKKKNEKKKKKKKNKQKKQVENMYFNKIKKDIKIEEL